MSKMRNLALAVVVGAAFAGSLQATDSSATATVRRVIAPVGDNPQQAILKGTVTATPTAILDLPSGVPSNKIVDADCRATDSEGVNKPLKVGVFGRTVSATSSGAPSGTLAVGDIIRCRLTLEP